MTQLGAVCWYGGWKIQSGFSSRATSGLVVFSPAGFSLVTGAVLVDLVDVFASPQFVVFVNGESEAETRTAGLCFDSASCHDPSCSLEIERHLDPSVGINRLVVPDRGRGLDYQPLGSDLASEGREGQFRLILN